MTKAIIRLAGPNPEEAYPKEAFIVHGRAPRAADTLASVKSKIPLWLDASQIPELYYHRTFKLGNRFIETFSSTPKESEKKKPFSLMKPRISQGWGASASGKEIDSY